MIRLFETISFVCAWAYAFVFFWTIRTFLPLRKNVAVKIAAFLICGYLSDSIIYSNDLAGLLGTMLAFVVYVLIFYRGKLMEKLSVVLVFYPALIAVNYLRLDIGGRMFRLVTGATFEEALASSELMLISTAIHTLSGVLRLLFWVGAWLVLRKFLAKITAQMTIRMWLIVDALMLASFVAIFTIIYFMPEDTAIVYPICVASIVSSFGCMYLASYICDAAQASYRAQQLEMQSNYYRQKIQDEERVRSVYHDMKNHLLILENEAGHTAETRRAMKALQEQIQDYENYYHTGNEYLDIIVRDKARAAREKEIDCNMLIHFGDASFLDPLDISTIFGNALDNAIEASEKLAKGERLITVKADRMQDMLVIVVSNNTLPDSDLPQRTSKEDAVFHGFGLTNIKNAVEKYDGQCSIRLEDGVFTLKIIIPIP